MVKGLYTAWTGMLDEQNRLDILTNNLANADTTGYQKYRYGIGWKWFFCGIIYQ